jgi:hypothetical protein
MNWKHNEVYAQNLDSELGISRGNRMPHFYLHNEAANINGGYDICNGNTDTLANCFREGAFLCRIILSDNTKHEAICFSKFNSYRMAGFICLLSDEEGIKSVIKEHLKLKTTPSMDAYEIKYLQSIDKYKFLEIL